MQSWDKNDIFEALNEGDEWAFERMFKSLFRPLCLYATAILGNVDSAEEVVQEMFVNLWNKRGSYIITGDPKNYIILAVRNASITALNQNRKLRLEQDLYQKELSVYTDFAYDLLSAPEREMQLRQQILKALDRLPPQCRNVFEMHRLSGYTYKEIAEELDISVKAVEKHISRALEILRKELSPKVLLLFLAFFNKN
ncbi:MAG: RNA polymerase sigma-70 factor [Bacteroidales bacterium]|nr:RNA polymerase sigma-70 factor [Bacteroidales bacterium]MBN2749097.1 RNA polymerase sigma-70 factor [Bacteroidales bacterium]